MLLILLLVILLSGGFGYQQGWGLNAGILPTVLLMVLVVMLVRGGL